MCFLQFYKGRIKRRDTETKPLVSTNLFGEMSRNMTATPHSGTKRGFFDHHGMSGKCFDEINLATETPTSINYLELHDEQIQKIKQNKKTAIDLSGEMSR